MQIEKKFGDGTLPSLAVLRRGASVAQEHASLFPTQLALARWTRGGDIPHVHASERNMPMRAAWFAQAQTQFQAWLDAGGFQQDGRYCPDCAPHEACTHGAGADTEADRLAVTVVPLPEDKR